MFTQLEVIFTLIPCWYTWACNPHLTCIVIIIITHIQYQSRAHCAINLNSSHLSSSVADDHPQFCKCATLLTFSTHIVAHIITWTATICFLPCYKFKGYKEIVYTRNSFLWLNSKEIRSLDLMKGLLTIWNPGITFDLVVGISFYADAPQMPPICPANS